MVIRNFINDLCMPHRGNVCGWHLVDHSENFNSIVTENQLV